MQKLKYGLVLCHERPSSLLPHTAPPSGPVLEANTRLRCAGSIATEVTASAPRISRQVAQDSPPSRDTRILADVSNGLREYPEKTMFRSRGEAAME